MSNEKFISTIRDLSSNDTDPLKALTTDTRPPMMRHSLVERIWVLIPDPKKTWRFLGVPVLPSLKGVFPFRLSTTSYIIPDAILPNVEFLGPYLDEVELVLFESGQETNLPSVYEVRELGRMGQDMGITYNVHLPTDIFLGDPVSAVRNSSVEAVLRFHDRTIQLAPRLYVLHLETRSSQGERVQDREAWMDSVRSSLEALWRRGMDPKTVSVENLEYPPNLLEPLIEEMGMWHCVDVGHLIRYGFPVGEELGRCISRCAMVHLHGVEKGIDHRGLDLLPDGLWKELGRCLGRFRGGVSIEVFSLEHLARSMERISAWAGFVSGKESGV